jgi:hypothetical protein
MFGNTSRAAETRLPYIGIADAADPWRAGSESRSARIGFSPPFSVTSGIPWGQSTQVAKC